VSRHLRNVVIVWKFCLEVLFISSAWKFCSKDKDVVKGSRLILAHLISVRPLSTFSRSFVPFCDFRCTFGGVHISEKYGSRRIHDITIFHNCGIFGLTVRQAT
jgi:hypothetical protein